MYVMIEVEVDEDAESHADRSAVVEGDEVAFGEDLGQPNELGLVVEIVGIDGGEDRQLEGFERRCVMGCELHVLDGGHGMVTAW